TATCSSTSILLGTPSLVATIGRASNSAEKWPWASVEMNGPGKYWPLGSRQRSCNSVLGDRSNPSTLNFWRSSAHGTLDTSLGPLAGTSPGAAEPHGTGSASCSVTGWISRV